MNAPLRPAEWVLDLSEPIAALGGSPDGSLIAVLGTEGSAWVVEASSGRRIHAFQAHEGGGFRLVWNPTAPCFATAGQDGQVRFWDPVTGTQVESLPMPSAWVEQLAGSPSGDRLAAASGKTVCIGRASGGGGASGADGAGWTHTLGGHRSTVAALAWSADGRSLGVACYGGVSVYDSETGRVTAELPWKTSLVSLAISPDGRWVVAGTQESSVQIWPLPFREGEELAMSGYDAKVRSLAWHHSGRYLATDGGQELMVWDCSGKGPAGSTPRILEGHPARASSLAYQKTGHLLASGCQAGRVLFWNAGKSSQPLRATALAGAVTALGWLPGDTQVVAGCQDGRLALISAPKV